MGAEIENIFEIEKSDLHLINLCRSLSLTRKEGFILLFWKSIKINI
jgi:hypothetical protein